MGSFRPSRWPNTPFPIVHGTKGRIRCVEQTRGDLASKAESLRRRRRDERRLHLYAPPPPPPAGSPSRRRRLQEQMAGYNSSRVQKKMEGTSSQPKGSEMIQVFIDEETEIEAFRGVVSSLTVCGKMSIAFPPSSDRVVQFILKKLYELELRSHPRINRDVLKMLWIVQPKSAMEPFDLGPYEILNWRKQEVVTSPMIKVTAQTGINIMEPEGVVRNVVHIIYYYTGPTNVQDLVIKVSLPTVDETGEARKLLKTHIWRNTGEHFEGEHCIAWHIGSVNESKRRGDFTVDSYYQGGSFDRGQFYPVTATFSYLDCRGLVVSHVRGSDGHLLEFEQRKRGHARYMVQAPDVMARRAAAAESAAKSWQREPWNDEGGHHWGADD